MRRREVFAGNWKMYKSYGEAKEFILNILKELNGQLVDREIAIFPPAIYLREIVQLCKDTPISIGIQNIHFKEEGAYTGEISPIMAKDTGVKYVLIGHSERRQLFCETDSDVNKKIQAVFEHGLIPIICIGETFEEKEDGRSKKVLKKQLSMAFKDIDAIKMKDVIIAYEPIWAIGTGKVSSPDNAETMHNFIREILKELFCEDTANSMPILYGGSVKPNNITGLYNMKNIDGVLVGGASLNLKSFLDIIHVSK